MFAEWVKELNIWSDYFFTEIEGCLILLDTPSKLFDFCYSVNPINYGFGEREVVISNYLHAVCLVDSYFT